MLIEKGFTDNWLQPTGAQERLLRQYAGCKRFVWNRALSIEQARYCRGEKMVGCTQMMRELTMWRNNPDPHSNFLREAPVHALQCVLWELYESYDKFSNKEQVHPPQFKKKAKARLSFTESDPALFELDQPNKREVVEMKSKKIPTSVSICGISLCLAIMAHATQDRFALKAPNEVAFSEFRGYETWQDVAVSQTGGWDQGYPGESRDDKRV